MGLPYVGRSCSCACCLLFGGIEHGELSFVAAFSSRLRAGRSAKTSAHSRLPLAKLQKAPATDGQPPNRFSRVRGSYFPSTRYPRHEGRARFLRPVSPQSARSSLSWSDTLSLRGSSPAALTASFHLGKNFATEYLVIPAREKNSECDGARPSRLAMAPIESKICCLPDIGSLFRPCFGTIAFVVADL